MNKSDEETKKESADLLAGMFQGWPPEQFEIFRAAVLARSEEFRMLLKLEGPTAFVKKFYALYDEVRARDHTPVSCHKGCHFCCRQNVATYGAEAAVIAEYCQEHHIGIPKAYLEEQLKYGWKEMAGSEAGWCVFLKNGQCSIYPVRPVTCRNYFVVSRPELCDTVKYPSAQGHRVAVKLLVKPLALAIAFEIVLSELNNEGRLPAMLLPYSK